MLIGKFTFSVTNDQNTSGKNFIIIIIIIIIFMQGIYTYISGTNCVPSEYSVAAILLLLFTVFISLVSVLNLSYSTYTLILSEVCVQFLDFMFSRYVAHVFSK